MKLLPSASIAALLLATTTTTTAYVLPSSSSLQPDLVPRYVSGLVAPSSYTYSWAIDGYRLALNTTGAPSYLTRYTVSKDATSTTQQHVNSCTAFCEKTAGCAMASVIKFVNFPEGTVICAVYGTVLGKSEAKYTTGLFNGPGEVKASYSFARNAGAVKGASSSSTVRSSTTSSVRTSSSTSAAQSTTKSSSTISSSTTASTRATTTTSSTTTSTQSTTTTSSASTPTSSASTSTSSASTSTSSASSSTSSASTSTSSAPTPSSTLIYDQWQWVDVPGTSCADGTATGFALSLHANSTELVFALQQGGSCYDYQTCYVDKRAYNVGGSSPAFNNATFYSQNQPSSLPGWFPFARGNQYNPWANSNYAWVPYCTGDFHAGDNVANYNGRQTYHKGWGNVKLDMAKVKEMVPGLKRVWLIGSSAGGFGSILQYQNVQDAFGVRVDLLADSAETPLSILRHPSQNIQPPNQSRCPNCNDTNFDSYIVGLAQANPTSRFGSMSWSNDSTIPANQGVSSQDFATEVERLFTEEDAKTSNARNYMVQGSGHILLYTTQYSAADGYTMANWLNKFKTDDPGWSSH